MAQNKRRRRGVGEAVTMATSTKTLFRMGVAKRDESQVS